MINSKVAHRAVSILVLLVISTIAGFASFGNITDPASNMMFVEHIFKMDTTFNSPNLMWRAIDSPLIQKAGFVVIIILEGLAGIIGWIGTYKLVRSIFASDEEFESKKTLGFISFGLAILVWGLVFQAFGGEWFASWQSAQWNGLVSAMRIVLMAILGTVLLKQAN